MAMQPKNRHKIQDAINMREPFVHASMSGVKGSPDYWGQLPHDIRTYCRNHIIEYTVYSYVTPIAIVCDGAVLVFNERYSATTTNHQSTVMGANNAAWATVVPTSKSHLSMAV